MSDDIEIKLSRKDIEILIEGKNHQPVNRTIKAWVYEPFLAIHKDTIHDIWVLSHIPTGKRICYLKCKYKRARQIIARVKDIDLWGKITTDTNVYNEFYDEFSEIRSIIGEYEE